MRIGGAREMNVPTMDLNPEGRRLGFRPSL